MAREQAGRRPTVETISAEAGVSVSTVSRALRNDPRISAERREAIAAIAQRLGYTPHANARALVTRRTGIVGFVTGSRSNPFYPQLLETLVERARLRALRIMPLHMSRDPLSESSIQALLQYQMDGCIITSAELSSRAADICQANEVPLVMVNRVPRLHGCAVSCNNFAGGEMIGAFLAAGGHRRIAIVLGTPNASTSSEREAGASQAAARAGLEILARVAGHSTYAGGFEAASVLWSLPERPDAIFCVNDIMAFGMMDGLRRLGVRIPEDVSVVGFDDVDQASWGAYDLTTVAQPVGDMVDRALDMLDMRIRRPGLAPEIAYLGGLLKVRSSARSAPA
ncbi:LacI family DNA-binding transcriptional regulator [Xanthobacter tagetidis]|jgi:LacI family transcriptional regulator|nr:LacI family DNA-binding transcriptional regulator [Xanthobacter tagetidis]